VATMTGVLWQDIIDPVLNVTLTSCYLSQIFASALATTLLPPFSKLVCPDTWESYNVNSTLVIDVRGKPHVGTRRLCKLDLAREPLKVL
jgi:hypothetical protein